MNKEELEKRKEKIERKISDLGELSEKPIESVSFADEFMEGLEAIPEIIPAAFLPAMLGAMMYSDILEEDIPKAEKVAVMTLASVLAVPCFALTAVIAAPIAAITIPTSLGIAGAKKIREKITRKRIEKIPGALERLEAQKEQVEKEISQVNKNKSLA